MLDEKIIQKQTIKSEKLSFFRDKIIFEMLKFWNFEKK
jgi:hypothetical protein